MSLTQILKKQAGRTNLKNWFRYHFPNPKLATKKEIIVNPKFTNSPYLGEVGTAFDYLMRFNLERINNKTFKDRGHWVAESGLQILLFIIDSKKTKGMKIGYIGNKKIVDRLKFRKYILIEFETAKLNHKKFITDGKLTKDLIKSSLFLAKLDVVCRTYITDLNFEEFETEKIFELEELFNIVPWEQFKTKDICSLNPSFGNGSALVGGADADLILDNTLVDIKTNKDLKIKREDLNQIIGYFLLSIIGKIDMKINTIGIYFARYGYFWQVPLIDFQEINLYPKLAYEFAQLVRNRELNLINSENEDSIKISVKPKQKITEYLIDKNDFKCPYCDSKKFIRIGKSSEKFRYKCKKCNKSFTSEIQTTEREECIKNLEI